MNKVFRFFLSIFITFVLLFELMLTPSDMCYAEAAEEISIESPSVILMELNSGQILYEKDADNPLRPASVTKIMTMLLAFDAVDNKKLNLDDEISISEHAAGMGGSQVYLEAGEKQTFQDLLKCMIVSSANDAAVAVGETIAGSEEAFVAMMNEKAKEIGMTNSNFMNACGLEAPNHVMSARDIAILSRHLILTHPEVFDYSTIWMDTITHKTSKGESEFGLANTNKFLKKYDGANGLKTGYTSAAGFSMSATATKNGMTLIAVVMGSKTKEIRYSDAEKLLNYGFANCYLYEDNDVFDQKKEIDITGGESASVKILTDCTFSYALVGANTSSEITKQIEITNNTAPIKKGDILGNVEYYMGNELIGKVEIKADEDVEKEKYPHVFLTLIEKYVNID